ncbi:protein FAM204A isoform X2 [Betta splendens]|uniref:Protein FAM204A isoform X2 n=1 Tax=Betta splendens TaxID=158456 RepID=A0A9W2X925_BETSP|nr:protein FAM204A isoform X2 [Betta splendens]
MYSGLLPNDLTEDDLSPDDEEDKQENDAEEKTKQSETRLISSEKLSSAGENTDTVIETQSSHTASDADSEFPTCGMPGISQEMWQKFQDLRKKNDEMKSMKVPRRRKRRRHVKEQECRNPTGTREHQGKQKKHWDELEQYFGVNDRFDPPTCSKPCAQSGLEKSIEKAIAEGDIAKAEEMSDRLATREGCAQATQERETSHRNTPVMDT